LRLRLDRLPNWLLRRLLLTGPRGPQPDDCVQVTGPALVTRNDSFLVTLTAGRQVQKSFGGTKSTTAFLAPLAW
jgi:hypothetical protein